MVGFGRIDRIEGLADDGWVGPLVIGSGVRRGRMPGGVPPSIGPRLVERLARGLVDADQMSALFTQAGLADVDASGQRLADRPVIQVTARRGKT